MREGTDDLTIDVPSQTDSLGNAWHVEESKNLGRIALTPMAAYADQSHDAFRGGEFACSLMQNRANEL